MTRSPAFRFEASHVALAQCPREPWPEVAFSGRSNVGKSSLLNRLAGQRHLAKVSQKPGKTRALNYFRYGEKARLVDLPGYGYAKVDRDTQARWQVFMQDYLERRAQLAGIVQLLDCRHAPSEQDRQMVAYLAHRGLPFLLVMTKADKISRGARQRSATVARKTLELGAEAELRFFSAVSGEGKGEVLAWISQALAAWRPTAEDAESA